MHFLHYALFVSATVMLAALILGGWLFVQMLRNASDPEWDAQLAEHIRLIEGGLQ